MKDGPKTNSCRQNSEDEHRKRNDTKEEKTLNYKRDPRILRKQPDSIKKARGLSQLSHKGESNYYCVVAQVCLLIGIQSCQNHENLLRTRNNS